MTCGIYKITNQINGKVYIGQSKRIEERWKEHKKKPFLENSEEYSYPLYQAIRKYGLKNFTFEIIEECLPKDLNQKEIDYISLYESYPPEHGKGYNQTSGGSNNEGALKLSSTQIKEIRDLLKNSDQKFIEIVNKFNIGYQSLSEINNGRAYYDNKISYPIRITKSHPILKRCRICGKIISNKAKYCVKHRGELLREQLPLKEEILKAFYELKNCQKVADKFNISTVLLKKQRKELDLPEKVKDIIELYQREYLGIVKEEKIKNPNYMAPIKQIDKDTEEIIQIFENPTQAIKYIQENYQPNNKFENISMCIHNCLQNRIKTACGFKWEYLSN